MVNIVTTPEWKSVRILEQEELALGGENGNMNEQAIALVARSEFLKQRATYQYNTLAEANADIANITVNQNVNVVDSGLYKKDTVGATSLTKSPYDPLAQAKADATAKANTAKSEAISAAAADATTKANAAEANAKVYTNSKLDFISNIAENNQFIKELYVTGWNGTNEIYLTEFNGNDGGKVTFRFKDKTASRDVIFTYQLAQGLQVYPLNTNGAATGSGFGGYIVIDWNAYTTSIFTGSTYTHKVSRKALSLVNCPVIREYVDILATNAQVSTNTSDITSLKTVNAKSLTLASNATHAKVADINNFIKSVKIKAGYSSALSYFVESVVVTATTAVINMKSFNSVDSSTAWISYNTTLTKSSDGVQTFEVKRDSYIILVTVDWNIKPSSNITGGTVVTLPLNASRLTEKDIIDLELAQPAFYKVRNDFKDSQSKLNHIFSAATFSASGDTAYTQAVTQVADGTRVVLTNTNVNVNRRFRYNFYPFYVRMKDTYFMYVKYTINSVSTPSNTMLATLSRSGKTAASTNFFDNVEAGKTYEEVRKLTGDPAGETSNEGSLYIDFWSASNSPAGIVLDITIHDIRLVANYAQDPVFINKERKEIEQLVRALGYFEEEIIIPKFVDTALSTQNINRKLKMQSLGDSTSAMVMWQERLAQLKGWYFSRDLALNGKDGGYPVALGGSWCEPIISNFGAIGAVGQNQYTRSTSISNYGIDVLFVLSSYNGQHIGKAWQTGGQLVKADHGINDAAYLGTEVNLIANPTADFPSFGASYYGMLEKIMTANPNTRIVLLTLYLFNVTGNDLANILAKNAVIRKAAEKYNLQLIDLEKISGINSFTASTLCFAGGVHINQKGGDRLAQVIGGIV